MSREIITERNLMLNATNRLQEDFMHRRTVSFVFLLAILFSFNLFGEEPSVGGKLKADPIYQSNGVAIHGYDPVAYFQGEKPVKGKKEFEHQWMGATWRFSNAENRDLFKQTPEKYAPQYGGYCAYGMSSGYAAPTEADAWSIVNGKLYLNYNREVRKMWNKDIPGYVVNADRNWPQIPKKN
jgi:YHS domain-containing protein